MKKIVRSFVIDDNLWGNLKEYAFKHKESISQIINELVKQFLEKGE